LLHWPFAAFILVLIGTGLRIAADEPAMRWLNFLDPILPRESLWYWHLIGAVGFTAIFAAYISYMITARLGARVRIGASRFSAIWRGGAARWPAFGVVVLWFAFGAFTAEIVSGILLFLGQAGWALNVHRNAVWLCIVFPFLHVTAHYLHGGFDQLLRIVRPTKLVVPPPPPDVLALLAEHVQLIDDLRQGRKTEAPRAEQVEEATRSSTYPLLTAFAVGSVVVAGAFVVQWQTAWTLIVPAIDEAGRLEAPVLDGDISDPIWSYSPPIRVLTDQGASFGGTGESWVEIRAAHDKDNIFIALVWEDKTRSLKHRPLIKRIDGWHVASTQPTPETEEFYNEDQFSVLLSPPTVPVVGGAIHLSPRPVDGLPPGASGRGLHYTNAGSIADLWIWRADHGGLVSTLEDAHFAPPSAPTSEQLAGNERYAGGYVPDAGDDCFIDNFLPTNHQDASHPAKPIRLPKDLAVTALEMGDIHGSPDVSESEDARWWLRMDDSEPYSAERDVSIPLRTVIPGILMTCTPSGDRADVKGIARWSADRWTLELSRPLDTKSPEDLPIQNDAMIWLAAFDHAATRHTRHIRPIYLDIR
jgi:hypothetical protein